MFKTARGFAAVLPIWLLMGAGISKAQIPPGTVEVAPTTEEWVRVEKNGITLTGGRLGGQPAGCRASPRAYLKAADGTGGLWFLSQHAFGCDLQDSQSLFAGVMSFDPAYVVGSALFDARWDSGEIFAVGEVHLAWLENDEEVSGTGTIVLHIAADGSLLRDGYLGPTPNGPPTVGGCQMICRRAAKAADDRGGRGLTPDRGGVLVTGWATAVGTGDRELEVVRFDGTPLAPVWQVMVGTPSDDEGHAVIASDGEVFALGHTGSDRDVFLARILEGGIPAEQVVFAGISDDEGRTLAFDPQGRLLAAGIMSEQLVLGAFELTAEGQKERSWNAVIDRNLQPISAQLETLLPPGQKPQQIPGLPIRKEPEHRVVDGRVGGGSQAVESHAAVPVAYQILAGSKGRGGLEEIASSDNKYLRIKAAGTYQIELEVTFDPDPEPEPIPLFLKEVTAEVFSEHCYLATVMVNGVASEDFLVAGQRSLCPSEEPVLRVPISKQMSEALGFDGRQVMVNDQRVVVRLLIDFEGVVDPWNGYASEPDSSVDEVGAEVEY